MFSARKLLASWHVPPLNGSLMVVTVGSYAKVPVDLLTLAEVIDFSNGGCCTTAITGILMMDDGRCSEALQIWKRTN
jgi:hypothetical protein